MFDTLINLYPKSEVLDFGYVGLGELAYRAKDYPKALGLVHEGARRGRGSLPHQGGDDGQGEGARRPGQAR